MSAFDVRCINPQRAFADFQLVFFFFFQNFPDIFPCSAADVHQSKLLHLDFLREFRDIERVDLVRFLLSEAF